MVLAVSRRFQPLPFVPAARARALLAATFVGASCIAAASLAAGPHSGAGGGSFGVDGLAFHRFPPKPSALRVRVAIVDLVAAGHGKMVAALGAELPSSKGAYFGTARFNADGSLDRSFGHDGFASVVRPRLGGAIGLVHGQAEAAAVDSRGRIVIAGYRYRDATSTVRYPVLLRLLPDGALDRKFGRDGVVTPRRVPDYGEWFSDLAVRPGGRIVAVGGRTQLHEENEQRRRKPAALARAFLPDGRIDRGFADRGSLSSPVATGRAFTAFRTVRVVRGGKLLVSGYRRYRLLLERLTPDGRPDPSFGRGGAVAVGFAGSECFYLCEYDSALMLTRDHRILVQGVLNPIGSEREALVRFLPDGRVDRRFGHRGFVYDRFAENLLEIGGIAPAPHGRFVVVGFGTGRSGSRYSLLALRFNADGRLDTSFGERGMLPLGGPGKGASGGETALARPDGSVVAAGWARRPDNSKSAGAGSRLLMLARLH
jgi:uncharacterized delta-60 repeat protein